VRFGRAFSCNNEKMLIAFFHHLLITIQIQIEKAEMLCLMIVGADIPTKLPMASP